MGFEPRLGLLECVLLSVGGMVGSAIFIFPGTTGRLIGPGAIVAWVIAGVLMIAIALCYAELSLAFPKTGGPAEFPFRTLGPSPLVRAFASYLEGMGYTVGWIFGLTISALAIGDYLAVIVPAASGHTVVIALLALWAAAGLNILGVNLASRTNFLLAAVLLGILLVFVGFGITNIDPTFYRPTFSGAPLEFFAAVQIAITAYGAWTAIPAAIEEIHRPQRTVPLAIVASLVLAIMLYTSLLIVIHGIIPGEQFVRGSLVETAPLRVTASMMDAAWITTPLAFAAILAIFTTLLVGILSASRVLYALGRNDILPRAVARTSTRFQSPWVGVLLVVIPASVLITVPQYFFELLVIAAVVGTGLPYGINIAAFLGLRYYRDDIQPAFRVPAGYAVAAIGAGALAVAMYGLGTTQLVWSVGSLLLIAALFVLRLLTDRRMLDHEHVEQT